MRRRGGLLVAIPPGNTSRCCPECGQVAVENRKTQARFACVACGFRAPADLVAAWNIKEAGLASLARSHPSGAVSPSCQEPTEGIAASPPRGPRGESRTGSLLYFAAPLADASRYHS